MSLTPDQHRAEVNAVRASLLLAENRSERHNVYRLSEQRACPKCRAPRSFLFCNTCDRPAA